MTILSRRGRRCLPYAASLFLCFSLSARSLAEKIEIPPPPESGEEVFEPHAASDKASAKGSKTDAHAPAANDKPVNAPASHGEQAADHGEESAKHGEAAASHGAESAKHGDESAKHSEEAASHGEEAAAHSAAASAEENVHGKLVDPKGEHGASTGTPQGLVWFASVFFVLLFVMFIFT